MLLTYPTMRQSSLRSASAPVRHSLRDAAVVHRGRPGRLVLQVLQAPETARAAAAGHVDPEQQPDDHGDQGNRATATGDPAPRHATAASPAAAKVLDLRGVELGVVVEVRHRRGSPARPARARGHRGPARRSSRSDALGVRVVGAAAPVDEPQVERSRRQRARGCELAGASRDEQHVADAERALGREHRRVARVAEQVQRCGAQVGEAERAGGEQELVALRAAEARQREPLERAVEATFRRPRRLAGQRRDLAAAPARPAAVGRERLLGARAVADAARTELDLGQRRDLARSPMARARARSPRTRPADRPAGRCRRSRTSARAPPRASPRGPAARPRRRDPAACRRAAPSAGSPRTRAPRPAARRRRSPAGRGRAGSRSRRRRRARFAGRAHRCSHARRRTRLSAAPTQAPAAHRSSASRAANASFPATPDRVCASRSGRWISRRR